MPARVRRMPTPLTKIQGQRGKAASGSLDHLQWLCPGRVHLHPLGNRSLITACNHLTTACPTTTQGSHHIRHPNIHQAQPSRAAAPNGIPLTSGKEIEEEAKKTIKLAEGLAAVLAGRGLLAVQIQPCSGQWGWEGPKHPPGASWGWAWQQLSQSPYIHGTKSSTVKAWSEQPRYCTPQGIIQGHSNCPLEKQKPGLETCCIMNDNGADSFKSSQGLFKAWLPHLREPFTGQNCSRAGRGT